MYVCMYSIAKSRNGVFPFNRSHKVHSLKHVLKLQFHYVRGALNINCLKIQY
jgi:hypothetical protein